MIQAAFPAALFLTILFCFCSQPPPLDIKPYADLCGSMFPPAAIEPGIAYGDVTIRTNGESYNGSIEIKQDRAGVVTADFYGPFGVAVASLHADSSQGGVILDGRQYSFALHQTMDSLPVEWGANLAFREFLQIILGRLPLAGTVKMLCKKQPDSIVKKRNAIIAMWKTDSIGMRMEISRKTGQLTTIGYDFNQKRPFWFLKIGEFNRGVAHKIEFRENDGNYFSIRYAKVTLR